MHVISRGSPSVVTFLRPSYDVTVSAVGVINPWSNAASIVTPTAVNDTTASTLLTAITHGDTIVYATGGSALTWYDVVASNGRRVRTYAISVSGTSIEMREPMPIDMAAGVVYGVQCKATVSLTADYTDESCLIKWTLSDGRVYEEEALVVSRVQICPVTSDDALRRWPKARNTQIPGQEADGLQPQVDMVWGMLRDRLWGSGFILDECRRPGVWKEYLFAELGLLLTEIGINLDGTQDRVSFRDTMERKRDAEWVSVMGMSNLWFDANDDETINPAEVGPVMRIVE